MDENDRDKSGKQWNIKWIIEKINKPNKANKVDFCKKDQEDC